MDGNQQLATAAGGRGLEQRAAALAAEMASRFRQLDPARRKWLVGTTAFLLACVIGLGWYAARPDWRTLYAGLDPQDARAMAAELTAANIPYDVSPDGTALRVSSDFLDKARLVTTAKGGPRSGRMGFELFDKPNWVGSEFDEKVNYQRALEGELEHTIDTLSGVEKSSGASSASSTTAGTDEAHLSSAASLASHAASLPDVRMDKVQSVQTAIAGGSYNVSSTDVAQSMVGHMLGNRE